MNLIDQYQFNTGPGPHHVGRSALPDSPPTTYPVRFIAYYLPQFHAIAENDEWWGKSFTEWTQVTKALPRYVGHYQPRLPADLGFYDLSSVRALEAQVELAKLGGVYGFCIHDYWFDGRKVLETPLNLLLANPQIDIPFCLNWANENWSRRWDGKERELLLQQNHSPEDDLRYAQSLKRAFQDERYIRVDGRPLLMLYRPGIMPDAKATVARWREFFVREGLGDPFVVMPQAFDDNDPRVYGMDAAAGFPPHKVGWSLPNHSNSLDLLDPKAYVRASAYDELAASEIGSRPSDYPLFPGVCPDWDNEPRKPRQGVNFFGSTPRKYGAWLDDAARYASRNANPSERIVFINAWNEWAEGAYLEPDRHHGFAYLAETRRVLDGLSGAARPSPPQEAAGSETFVARPSLLNRARNKVVRTLLGA